MATKLKMLSLLETLNAATAKGRLHWSGSFSLDHFMAHTNNATITISKDMIGGYNSYTISLRDAKGKVIENDLFDHGDVGHGHAEILYESARRDALKVDQFIDNVIADLEGS